MTEKRGLARSPTSGGRGAPSGELQGAAIGSHRHAGAALTGNEFSGVQELLPVRNPMRSHGTIANSDGPTSKNEQ